MISKIFKIFAYTFAIIIFILFAILGFTQSKFFKERLRVILTSTISQSIDAKFNLGTIRGNFITGFSIDSISIYHEDEKFFSTGKIKLSHEPLTIIGKKITINSLIIDDVEINILKSSDSAWNVRNIFKSSKSESKPLDWIINLKDIKINNIRFNLYDSTCIIYSHPIDSFSKYLDYRHLQINNLNLHFSALIKDKDYKLNIKKLNGFLPSTNFVLESLSGEFIFNQKNIEVKNLLIKTSRSQLKIDAVMKDINFFRKVVLEDFEAKPVQLRLLANRLDLNEFKSFLSPVYFLNGNIYVDLEAEGTFDHININRLEIQTLGSYISSNGSILFLHKPKNLFLDVKINNSRVVPADANSLLPFFKIPKFENIKSTQVKAHYNGTPLNFSARLELNSNEIGSANINLKLDLQDILMKYNAGFSTKNFDLSKLFTTAFKQSSLNLHGTIQGEGTKLENLNTNISVNVDSSIIEDVKIANAKLDFAYKQKIGTTEVEVNSNVADASIKLRMNNTIPEFPEYELKTNFKDFNLEKIFKDTKSTDLAFQMYLSARGKDFKTMNCNMDIKILPSKIEQYTIEEETIAIDLNQYDSDDKKLSLKSSLLDMDLRGKFNLLFLIPVLKTYSQSVISEINKRLGSQVLKDEAENNKILVDEDSDFNIQYKIRSKDLTPFSKMFLKQPLNFIGDVEGKMKNYRGKVSGEIELNIKDFFIGTESKGTLISNSHIQLLIDSLVCNNISEKSRFSLGAVVEQLNINKLKIQDVKVESNYSGAKGNLTLQSGFGENVKFQSRIDVIVGLNKFEIFLNELNLDFKKYQVYNDSIIKLTVNEKGFYLDNFIINTSKDEKLIFKESSISGDDLKINVELKNFMLENLMYFSEKLDNFKNFNGITNIDINVEGKMSDLILDCNFTIDTIIYKNSKFGSIDGEIFYSNKNLEIDLNAYSLDKNRNPILKLVGNMPIDLSLGEIENRFPNERVNLEITSSGFNLGILTPLIPFIDDLTGELVCDVSIKGTPQNPYYFGNIEFRNTRFLLLTNYIYYNLSGNLVSDIDKISFNNFALSNDENDYSNGKVSISGYFSLKEYKLSNFDVVANGELLLLKEGVRRRLHGIYGKLITATGEEGVVLKGKVEQSNISGKIIIKEANLVFPPTQTSYYEEASGYIKYVAVNDTIKISKDKITKSEYFEEQSLNRRVYRSQEIPTQNKFLNGLSYDVQLLTKGTTAIRMIFNPATNEELYAELDGKLSLQRSGNKNYFIGEISVSERSYYNFFKRFDASGKLKFIGDPDNPELEIKATYTGDRTVVSSMTDTAFIEQKVIITLDITGNRMEPKLKMSILIDGKDYSEIIQSGDLQSDAISFLFTNKFREDLTAREKSDIISGIGASAGRSLLAGATSTMLSGILTDFLRREFGFIRTAEVTYSGGSLQQSADLRLSGQIFNAYWRFGGKVFDDINNANVSFILNFGDIFESPKIRNFYLELERKVDGREYSIDKKLTNSAKIYYKWSF